MRVSQSLVVLLLSVLLCATLAAPGKGKNKNKRKRKPLPKCAEDDEDCREQFMHPDMLPSMARGVSGEETSTYWLQNGLTFVQQKLATADEPQRGVAKNVIFFLGDGMSLTTLAATRVYLGGEAHSLSFEQFPDTGLAKTYAIDRLVPDSASTATAYLGGVKAMFGTIGVNGHVKFGDCVTGQNPAHHVDSIAKWALAAGKQAGLVTTTRVTDASPAGVYAHSSDRTWENDAAVREACGANSAVADIAQQLITGEVGRQLKVVLGGGKQHFVDENLYAEGKRTDGRHLIDEFLSEDVQNVYLESKKQLASLDVSSANRVLGLFNDDNLLYHLETELEHEQQQPTLSEMTRKAIELLQNSPEGYFLFVEGGLIDKAHHGTRAKLALDETAEFDKAIALARALTSQQDTLIVVSADHSHTMSISGYARRGNDIFGTAAISPHDKLPYMTLSYANGPSYYRFFNEQKSRRNDPEDQINRGVNDLYPVTVPMVAETHGGEDVPVYASGPWSHLFSGAYEQSTISHLMGFAACLGAGQTACD